MSESGPGKEKSYAFALKIVALSRRLMNQDREYTLAKQILKSGTSIGANVEEAIGGQSDRDFTAKISISYKEARETDYWLRILKDSGLLSIEKFKELQKDCDELQRILGSTIKTMKRKLKTQSQRKLTRV